MAAIVEPTEVYFNVVRDAQLRLVYSLMKPALRMAARLHVPVRTISELARLGYFEVLARDGLAIGEIADRFGQSSRHMRSLSKRLKTDFFAAEHRIGLTREVEDAVAKARPRASSLKKLLPSWPAKDLERAVERLVDEGRIERGPSGRLEIGRKYVVLASETFQHRIDALNHFLDGVYRAALERLVHDERRTAMMKTITFTAAPEELEEFVKRFEGDIRRELAALEESAEYRGKGERFTIAIALAAVESRAEAPATPERPTPPRRAAGR
jgi:hypothetical protein